jgi:hypothetical protein
MSGVGGRWTLYVRKDGALSSIYVERFGDRRVPVVPCDEAAVERAERACAELHAHSTLYEWPSPREYAVAALRAAGAVEE